MNDNIKNLPKEAGERLLNGIFKENPTFVLLLGMCPTLAVTTSGINGLGMGLTTMVVLALSNLIISLLRKCIPDKIRIPAFIVIIASFVTIMELVLKAYIPSLYESLGIYIPLIVVNCIILGRAEAYAYTHRPLPSFFDGIGMGLGFTFALTIIGSLREILGAGTVFGNHIMPSGYIPVSIFIMAPGAFFVLAILTAIQNKIKMIGTQKGKDMSKIQSGCGGNCLECSLECNDRKDIKKEEKVKENPVKEESGKTESPKEKPAKEKHVKEEPVKEEPVKEEPVKEEPVKEEPVKEEPVKEEPVKEEPVKEEPVKEEPVIKKEPVREEPVKEESVKEEPVKEEPSNKVNELESDDIEFFDLTDFEDTTKEVRKNKSTGKKKRKLDKAKMMLSLAEESLKEDDDNV